jgi:hypothetical protein
MLHEELPQVFAVFTVVFECGVMVAAMLGVCFIASLLHCFTVQPSDDAKKGRRFNPHPDYRRQY